PFRHRVRGDRARRGPLVQRAAAGVAVDGGGGVVDEVVHAVLVHGAQQGGGAADVGVVVADGHPGGPHLGLVRGEVHDGVHGVPCEDGGQGAPVADVQLVDRADEAARDALHPGEDLGRAVGVVVDDDHLVAVVQEVGAGQASDEAGPAGDQDG